MDGTEAEGKATSMEDFLTFAVYLKMANEMCESIGWLDNRNFESVGLEIKCHFFQASLYCAPKFY